MKSMPNIKRLARSKPCLAPPSQAQAPVVALPPAGPAPSGPIVGSGNFFSPIVGDLDKAIAFYRDGIGLDVTGAPANADANPALRNMFGLPDAQIRWSIGRPPAMRTGVEIVEIRNAGGKPLERRIQDVGAFTLIVVVRDVDAALARARQVGAPVVTSGGMPVSFGTSPKVRAVIIKDPDGHFVAADPARPGAAGHRSGSDRTSSVFACGSPSRMPRRPCSCTGTLWAFAA